MPIADLPNPPPAQVAQAPERKVIGQAFIEKDGTIVMDLRAEDPKTGSVGDARLTYPPSDPQYKTILDHLGGLRPGEVKPVMNDWQ